MSSQIVECGSVGADGKMRLPMERVSQFFAQHKGQRLIITFEAVERGTESMLGYYFKYIVPTIRQAFADLGDFRTDSQIEEFLREESPICWANGVLLKAQQLTRSQMSDYILWLQHYAAENLFVYIEDPKCL